MLYSFGFRFSLGGFLAVQKAFRLVLLLVGEFMLLIISCRCFQFSEVS